MSEQEVGVLEMDEIVLPPEAESDWYNSSGLVVIKNGHDSQPTYELPGKIRISAVLILDDHNLFDVDDHGIVTFHSGVLNGWAKYRLDTYDPFNEEFTCVLRDGEIVHPSVALRELRGAMVTDE